MSDYDDVKRRVDACFRKQSPRTKMKMVRTFVQHSSIGVWVSNASAILTIASTPPGADTLESVLQMVKGRGASVDALKRALLAAENSLEGDERANCN